MNGNNDSPAKEKLAHVERLLNEYQIRKGVLPLKLKNDVEEYLNITKDEIKKLTQEEACQAAIILTRYALYLQDVYNIEIARVHWIDDEIARIITSEIKQYAIAYQSYEERKRLAIMGNDYTAELDKLRMWAQALADRLSFMANRVDSMARTFITLARK